MSDWNQKIIDEFRANEGEVGGPFQGATLLLLHHKGAKSGIERVSPLAYQPLDRGYAVFASKGGADSNPDWYYNVKSNPLTRIEVGTDTVDVHVREAEGDEYTEIWERQKARFKVFAEYEARTSREKIPVLILESA